MVIDTCNPSTWKAEALPSIRELSVIYALYSIPELSVICALVAMAHFVLSPKLGCISFFQVVSPLEVSAPTF